MPWLPRVAGARALIVGLIALVLTMPLDPILHRLAFRYVDSHEVRLLANGVTLLGTAWAGAGLLGGLALTASRTADLDLWRASFGGLAGIVVANVAAHLVKQVACRAWPRLVDGWGVDAVPSPGAGPSPPASAVADEGGVAGFFHWPCLVDSRYHSFPSGHATTAFAVAAALARAAPGRRRVWLAVAAGVGVSRVMLNAHFLSDVVGGAVIGWWGGELGQRLAARFLPRWLATWPARTAMTSRPGTRSS
jgi:membrane-associated phospholipid phosphatase